MVIVESVALAIMVSNDIVMPLVLQRREALIAGRDDVGRLLLTVRRVAIFVILLLRLPLLPLGRRGAARLHRPPVLRRHRAARAGLLRRPDLAARHRARRHRRHDGRHRWSGPTRCCCRASPTPASSASSILSRGPVGPGHAAAAGAVRARSAAAGARRALEPGAQHPRLCRLLARPRAGVDRAAAGRPVRAVRPDADRAELPPVALVGDGRGAHHHGRPLSRRGAHAHLVRQLCARPAASASSPRREADFQLLRYAEHLLASAIGAASSRLVLSLLLRKRTVSTKAALKLLDDANAAIQYNREILQTALDHVRQGIAVFDKDLHLICWNRQFGEILDLPPQLTRVGIGLDEILRFNAERGALRRRARRDARARPARALRLRAASRSCERFAERDLVIEVRANPHAGRRHRHHLHRHHAERGGGRSARARQRDAGAARARAHRGADAAQRRARRAPRPRPTRPTSPRPASSPPPATTSCSRSTPRGSTSPAWSSGRAAATTPSWSATSMPRSTRSRKSSARCSTSRGSTPAR